MSGHPTDPGRADTELLNTLLASTPDFVYFKDRQRRYVRVSQTLETLFGRPDSEIIGRRDEELLPEAECRDSVADDIQVIEHGRQIVNRLEGGAVVGGRKTWLLTTKKPWRTEDGEIRGLFGTSREVSDLKELRDSQRRAQELLDQIHDSVIAVDLDGFITSWNRGSDVLFGRTAQEMIGEHVSVVYPPEDHQKLETEIIAPLLEQGELHIEVRLLRATGEVFHAHLSLSVLVEDGEPVGMIGFTMDISERVEGERRRARLRRELDHRVKNSLAVVRSLARRTASRAQTLDAFVAEFSGRLDAMVAAHEALAANRWSGLPLRTAVDAALGGVEGIGVGGPDLVLSAECATPLCLALHELATNARKYGALKQDAGTVELHWSLSDRRVDLEWVEVGASGLPDELVPGFGLTLVRGLIEHEAGGTVDLGMTAQGLVVRMRLPQGPGAEGSRG